ncbi:uncharacterized protein LOC135156000 isoform X2 [Lytechinus pictus]
MASKITIIALLVVVAVVATSAFDFNDFEKRQAEMELDDAVDLVSQHMTDKRGRRFSVCTHPHGFTCWCDKKFEGSDKYYRVCDFAAGGPINGR